MLNADFYEQHTTWSHMLIFQLDCLLFKDELLHWCNSPWDYIGAPWFRGFLEKNRNAGLWAVGNGGFSLRKVSSFLKVLRAGALDGVYRKPYDSPHYGLLPDEGELIDSKRGVYRELLPAWERWPMVGHDWNVEQEAQRYMYNEDAFWSFEAMKFDPSFKVATVDEGLKFAFEMNPDWCLKQNGGMLPFGCHAWTRYNRAFWEEIIT